MLHGSWQHNQSHCVCSPRTIQQPSDPDSTLCNIPGDLPPDPHREPADAAGDQDWFPPAHPHVLLPQSPLLPGCFLFSVIVPKLLENLLSKWKTISFLECFTQISLVTFSGATEACLLSVMAYDQYQAVCCPLLYVGTMNKKVCAGLAGASWAIGMGTGLLNTILLAQQHFCGPNLIRSFACEFPPVLLLACSDPSMSVASILTTMVVLGLGSLVLLVGSYTCIILTALGINSATGWNKIFSTCSSHFLVVTTFYGSGIFRYVIAIPLNVNVGYFSH